MALDKAFTSKSVEFGEYDTQEEQSYYPCGTTTYDENHCRYEYLES